MSQIQEVKIRVFDLRLGMYICRLDKEWTETSYPLQGFFIENDNQIQKLVDECEYVYIDERKHSFGIETTTHANKSSYTAPPVVTKKITPKAKSNLQSVVKTPQKTPSVKKPFFNLKGLLSLLDREQIESDRKHTYQLTDIVTQKIATKTIKPPKKLASVSQELSIATEVHTQATDLLKIFMSNVKEGETLDMLIAEHAIHDCMLSALRSPDALLLASHLYKKHQSIWEHSMKVSVLAISLGRCLNLSDDELMTLGLCGMLHDIGALLISKEMLEEADNKIEMLQSHTLLGRDILLSCSGEFSETVAEVAYNHHEYLNGTGFTRGLRGKEISAYTRIITIIDLYVTLTSDTSKSMSHYEAILSLLEHTDVLHLDEVLVDSFSQCIGTYPVGCFVEMNTGEIGIVVEENAEQKLKPKIILVTTDNKKLRPDYLINLAALKNEEMLYQIAAIVHPDKYPELNSRDNLSSLKKPHLK
jgi:HD-GYP domain-containing protein (c-di-GMP phosphodiesterase class II)